MHKGFVKYVLVAGVALALSGCGSLSSPNYDDELMDPLFLDSGGMPLAVDEDIDLDAPQEVLEKRALTDEEKARERGRFDPKFAKVAPHDQVFHFKFDSNALQKSDQKIADIQAEYLLAHPTSKILLIGNTDERGSREYNVALGYRRAKSVAARLYQLGVAHAQVRVISFGEEQPVAFGHTEKAWGQNRRVDLMYEVK